MSNTSTITATTLKLCLSVSLSLFLLLVPSSIPQRAAPNTQATPEGGVAQLVFGAAGAAAQHTVRKDGDVATKPTVTSVTSPSTSTMESAVITIEQRGVSVSGHFLVLSLLRCAPSEPGTAVLRALEPETGWQAPDIRVACDATQDRPLDGVVGCLKVEGSDAATLTLVYGVTDPPT